MDAALNEFKLVGVNMILRDNPARGGSGDPVLHSEFQVIGQLSLDEFKKLRQTCQENGLELRCEFGNYAVDLRHLEYDSIKETFSLYLVQKV